MKPLLRRGADWVDLQWAVLERSLRAVAPRARGRLLDVGCGNKPYEAWFRPFVRSYIGVEHAATFARTEAAVVGAPQPHRQDVSSSSAIWTALVAAPFRS